MSATTINTPSRPNHLRQSVDRFFAGVRKGFDVYLESRSRMHQYEALNSKTDEELAAMKLKREDIVRHVYRDIYWL